MARVEFGSTCASGPEGKARGTRAAWAEERLSAVRTFHCVRVVRRHGQTQSSDVVTSEHRGPPRPRAPARPAARTTGSTVCASARGSEIHGAFICRTFALHDKSKTTQQADCDHGASQATQHGRQPPPRPLSASLLSIAYRAKSSHTKRTLLHRLLRAAGLLPARATREQSSSERRQTAGTLTPTQWLAQAATPKATGLRGLGGLQLSGPRGPTAVGA